ncbi:MAG: hypothetical protein ACTSYU_01310 [Promethearchaeota archaeon]
MINSEDARDALLARCMVETGVEKGGATDLDDAYTQIQQLRDGVHKYNQKATEITDDFRDGGWGWPQLKPNDFPMLFMNTQAFYLARLPMAKNKLGLSVNVETNIGFLSTDDDGNPSSDVVNLRESTSKYNELKSTLIPTLIDELAVYFRNIKDAQIVSPLNGRTAAHVSYGLEAEVSAFKETYGSTTINLPTGAYSCLNMMYVTMHIIHAQSSITAMERGITKENARRILFRQLYPGLDPALTQKILDTTAPGSSFYDDGGKASQGKFSHIFVERYDIPFVDDGRNTLLVSAEKTLLRFIRNDIFPTNVRTNILNTINEWSNALSDIYQKFDLGRCWIGGERFGLGTLKASMNLQNHLLGLDAVNFGSHVYKKQYDVNNLLGETLINLLIARDYIKTHCISSAIARTMFPTDYSSLSAIFGATTDNLKLTRYLGWHHPNYEVTHTFKYRGIDFRFTSKYASNLENGVRYYMAIRVGDHYEEIKLGTDFPTTMMIGSSAGKICRQFGGRGLRITLPPGFKGTIAGENIKSDSGWNFFLLDTTIIEGLQQFEDLSNSLANMYFRESSGMTDVDYILHNAPRYVAAQAQGIMSEHEITEFAIPAATLGAMMERLMNAGYKNPLDNPQWDEYSSFYEIVWESDDIPIEERTVKEIKWLKEIGKNSIESQSLTQSYTLEVFYRWFYSQSKTFLPLMSNFVLRKAKIAQNKLSVIQDGRLTRSIPEFLWYVSRNFDLTSAEFLELGLNEREFRELAHIYGYDVDRFRTEERYDFPTDYDFIDQTNHYHVPEPCFNPMVAANLQHDPETGEFILDDQGNYIILDDHLMGDPTLEEDYNLMSDPFSEEAVDRVRYYYYRLYHSHDFEMALPITEGGFFMHQLPQDRNGQDWLAEVIPAGGHWSNAHTLDLSGLQAQHHHPGGFQLHSGDLFSADYSHPSVALVANLHALIMYEVIRQSFSPYISDWRQVLGPDWHLRELLLDFGFTDPRYYTADGIPLSLENTPLWQEYGTYFEIDANGHLAWAIQPEATPLWVVFGA